MTSTSPSNGLLEVRLLGMPLEAYRAAAEHGDELRREFALIAAGEAVEGVPARLVTVMEALEVRFADFTAAPREALEAALDRGDDRIDLVYRVPPVAREAALELDRLLDEADEFCRRGDHLLTLAATPQVLALRRWFLSEFVAQIEGGPPTPWEDWAARQVPPADS